MLTLRFTRSLTELFARPSLCPQERTTPIETQESRRWTRRLRRPGTRPRVQTNGMVQVRKIPISIFFFFCTAMCWNHTHRSPHECWEIQGKDRGKETPQQGNLSKPCRPQLTPSSALSVRRHNADEAFEFTRHFFLLILAFH